MEDNYTAQIDNALALLAEKIAAVNQRVDSLSIIDLPADVIEMYAKAKIVEKYVAMDVPAAAALAIVGIEVDTKLLSDNKIDQSEVIDGYQTSMRSLKSSIDALKAIFDYAKIDEDTVAEGINETEDSTEENSTEGQ